MQDVLDANDSKLDALVKGTNHNALSFAQACCAFVLQHVYIPVGVSICNVLLHLIVNHCRHSLQWACTHDGRQRHSKLIPLQEP